MIKKHLLTIFYYYIFGATSALGLLLLYYRILLINSDLHSLYVHNSLTYFISYIVLTSGTAILFGISVSLFLYHYRKYGIANLFHTSGGGAGALIGILASSCPVCGSTILSGLGVIGGLSSLPFQGLEIKTLSFGLILLSVIMAIRNLKNKNCHKDICPKILDDSLKKAERKWVGLVLATLIIFIFAGWQMLRQDPFFAFQGRAPNSRDYSCNSSKKI